MNNFDLSAGQSANNDASALAQQNNLGATASGSSCTEGSLAASCKAEPEVRCARAAASMQLAREEGQQCQLRKPHGALPKQHPACLRTWSTEKSEDDAASGSPDIVSQSTANTHVCGLVPAQPGVGAHRVVQLRRRTGSPSSVSQGSDIAVSHSKESGNHSPCAAHASKH